MNVKREFGQGLIKDKGLSSSRFYEVLCLLALVFLLMLAPHPGIHISNNSSLYLDEAVRLAHGEGPTLYKEGLVARGPILTYAVALVLMTAGPSVEWAFMLMKLFFSLSMLLVYILTKECYGKKAAALATLFSIVSFRMYLMGTAIDTTALLTCFLTAFVISLRRAWKNPKGINFFLCGLFLALSFLTKETALLYFPLHMIPFLFYKTSFSSKFGSASMTGLGLFLPILPWSSYVLSKTGSLLPLLGHFNPEFRTAYSGTVGMDITSNFSQNFLVYLKDFFIEMLPSATFLWFPLVLLLIWHTFFLLWKRSHNKTFKEDLVIFLALTLYIPIPISDIGVGAGDPRQGYIIYLLLFIIASRWIASMIDSLSFRNVFHIPGKKVIVPTLAILVLATGLVAIKGRSYPTFLKIGRAISNYSPMSEAKSRYTSLQKEAIQWLERNIPAGTPLIVDGYIGEPIQFFIYQRYSPIPSFKMNAHYEWKGSKPIVFLLTYKKFRESNGLRRFFYVGDEPSLVQDLRPNAIVVFAHQTGFLRKYFDVAPWAQRLYQNDHTSIYRITGEPVPFADGHKQYISHNFEEDMEWAKVNDHDAFMKLSESLHSMGIEYPALIQQAYRLEEGKFL